MTTEIDVLIVGAGPAGSSTALHLAQVAPALARRTVIVDKASHPRHKLCGGGLVCDVDRILAGLGLDLSEVPYVDARWANLHFGGRGIRMKLEEIAFHVVHRQEFDAWLAARARDCGATLLEQCEVLRLAPDGDGVVVETSRGKFRARAVVGADGSKGIVRRSLFGAAGPVARLVEVWTPPTPRPRVADDEALFEFRNVPGGVQGYYWDFPMVLGGEARRNIGVYDSRVTGTPATGSLKEVLAAELAEQGVRLADCKVQGHPIHLFHPRSALARPGVLLAGDAAGADPLLGEGISVALGYGELAARALVDAFARGEFGFEGYTRAVHRSPLGRSLRVRHHAARLLYGLRQPWLQRAVWWRLQPVVRYMIREHVFRWAKVAAPAMLSAPAIESRA